NRGARAGTPVVLHLCRGQRRRCRGAARSALRNDDVDAGLTDVASRLVLVTVVDDALDPVGVPGLEQSRGYEVRDVPPDLRDVVEVFDTSRDRVGAWSEGEPVRARVGVPGQGGDDRVLRLVDRPHHTL